MLLAPCIAEAAFPGLNGKIAYTTCLEDEAGPYGFNCEVFVMNPDGSGKQNLTNHPETDYNPAWSADGRKIVFNSSRDSSQYQIWVMNADGSDPRPVTNETHGPMVPTWSPDGQKIAFTSDRHDPLFRYSEVYVINADGTGLRRLTQPYYPPNELTPIFSYGPVWSPDGERIAFSSSRWSNGDLTGPHLYTIRPDGTDEQRLGDLRGHSPDWYPDGTKMLFFSGSAIHVVNADGSGETALTPPLFEEHPVWSPDGQKILTDDGADNIWPECRRQRPDKRHEGWLRSPAKSAGLAADRRANEKRLQERISLLPCRTRIPRERRVRPEVRAQQQRFERFR